MPFFQKGDVRIRFEEAGSGFPLLVTPDGATWTDESNAIGRMPNFAQGSISYLNFLDWQRATRTFSSLAIYRHEDYNLTGRGQPERVNGLMVSASFFSTRQA